MIRRPEITPSAAAAAEAIVNCRGQSEVVLVRGQIIRARYYYYHGRYTRLYTAVTMVTYLGGPKVSKRICPTTAPHRRLPITVRRSAAFPVETVCHAPLPPDRKDVLSPQRPVRRTLGNHSVAHVVIYRLLPRVCSRNRVRYIVFTYASKQYYNMCI